VPSPGSGLVFGVSVLDADVLRREPTPSAPAALARLPSISIDEGAGVAGPTNIRLRGGEETFTQVIFDGVPLNITGGFMDVQGITLTHVGRVEVARGPLSAMYGSSAMAGAVQFLTPAGEPGRPRLSLLGEAGTSADYGGQAHSQVMVDGGSQRLRYSVGAGGTYFRGIYALPHDLRTWDGSARLDASLGRGWDITATVRYMDVASNLPVRDPGITRAPLDPNQRDSRNRWITSVATHWAQTPTLQHQVAVRIYRDDFYYGDRSDSLDPADFPYFVFDFDFRQTSVQWRETGEYTGAWRLAGGEAPLTLAYGGKLEHEGLNVRIAGAFGDAESQYDRNNGAGFVEVQGRLGPRVDLLAGVRYERFEGLSGAVLPRGGIAVAVVPGILRLRASAGRAFKAANLEQQYLETPTFRPNPDLAPETSVSWEGGLVATAPAAGVTAQGTFFHQMYDDLMRVVPLDTTGVVQIQNLGKSRILGVELELDKWWGTRWHAGVGATWLRSKMVENTGLPDNLYPVGSELLGVPEWTGNVVLDGDLTRVFSASLRGRVVGRQEVFTERFSGARATLDPYFLLGLTVRARLRPWLETYVRGENLLDAEYDTAYDRPGMPLTVIGGVRVTRI
jgi:outer membrane cobalamin receptor